MKRTGTPNFYELHSVLPTGVVLPYAGSVPPDGFLICDGSAVDRSTFSKLFGVVGTIWGPGDGSTTFNIPDCRGVFVRGYSGSSTQDPDSASRIPLNAGTFTLINSSTDGSSTVVVTDTTNLAPGMTVSGTNIPATSYVRVVLSPTTFTLGNAANTSNTNTTGSGSGITLTFSNNTGGNYPGSYQPDQFGSHNHTVGGNGGGDYAIGGVLGDIGGADFIVGGSGTSSSGGDESRPRNVAMYQIIKV